MENIDVAFEYFSLPDNINHLIADCREAGDEICSRSGQGAIAEFEPADGRISWNLLNSVVQQADCKPVFCEWGSGLGLVTLMAATIGMDATGIEIDEELVDLARGLSTQYAIPASFINASIYDSNPPINYMEVDLFFAYPWPAQIARTMALFRQVAASGAILICYHGGRNYRVVRRQDIHPR